MAHLDLVWPAVVLVLAIAGAIVVRIVATQGDRATRARHRIRLEQLAAGRAGSGGDEAGEVGRGSRGRDRDAAPERALEPRGTARNPEQEG